MRIFILLMLLSFASVAQTQVGADGINYDTLYFAGDNLNRLTIGDSTASKHYVDSVVAARGGGTVTNIATGFGIAGGPITTTGTVRFDSTTVFPYTVLKRDSLSTYTTRYRGDSIVNALSFKGAGTVTSVATGLGLTGGTITTSGTLLVDTANASILSRQRAANTYYPLTNPSGYGTGSVTSVAAGYGTTFSTITTTGTIVVDTASSTGIVSKLSLTNTLAAYQTLLPVTITGSGSISNTGTTALTGFTGSGTSSGTNTGDQISYLQLCNASLTTPVINTTYYFGNFFSEAPTANDSVRMVPVTRACTIKEVTFYIYGTTAGTNVTAYSVDVVTSANVHTSTSLGSFALTANARVTKVAYTGLSIAVGATDGIQIKVALPNSGVAPAAVRYSATIGIQ